MYKTLIKIRHVNHRSNLHKIFNLPISSLNNKIKNKLQVKNINKTKISINTKNSFAGSLKEVNCVSMEMDVNLLMVFKS